VLAAQPELCAGPGDILYGQIIDSFGLKHS
jgi:hypothetical protein